MSDNEASFDFCDDIQSLFHEEEDGEVAFLDQDIPADQLESLVGDDSLFTLSQLVGMVGQPSLGSPSPQSAEVEELLQPSLHTSWADSLEEEEEIDFLEQCLEV